jgi:hypothetical protein
MTPASPIILPGIRLHGHGDAKTAVIRGWSKGIPFTLCLHTQTSASDTKELTHLIFDAICLKFTGANCRNTPREIPAPRPKVRPAKKPDSPLKGLHGQQEPIATIGENLHGAPDCATETPRVTALAKDCCPVTSRGNAAALPVQSDNAPSKGQNQPANPCQPRGNQYPLTTAGPLTEN